VCAARRRTGTVLGQQVVQTSVVLQRVQSMPMQRCVQYSPKYGTRHGGRGAIVGDSAFAVGLMVQVSLYTVGRGCEKVASCAAVRCYRGKYGGSSARCPAGSPPRIRGTSRHRGSGLAWAGCAVARQQRSLDRSSYPRRAVPCSSLKVLLARRQQSSPNQQSGAAVWCRFHIQRHGHTRRSTEPQSTERGRAKRLCSARHPESESCLAGCGARVDAAEVEPGVFARPQTVQAGIQAQPRMVAAEVCSGKARCAYAEGKTQGSKHAHGKYIRSTAVVVSFHLSWRFIHGCTQSRGAMSAACCHAHAYQETSC